MRNYNKVEKMKKEWEYYNHALVPTTPPHVTPDTSWMNDRKKWKELADGHYPLFARWTTDFDCEEETQWWYVIRESPFELDKLGSKSRYHIRQSLRKCTVKKIRVNEYLEDLYRVYEEAYERYQNADNRVTYEQFCKDCSENKDQVEYWAGYDLSGEMIGYMTIIIHEVYGEISTAKFSAKYLNLRVSDALYYTILEYYLNEKGLKYLSSGQRSINHITNTQEYKIEKFQFRKAYCHLHIKYQKEIACLVTILYPFRNIMEKFEKYTLVHQIMAVLRMEEIHRKFQKN